MTASSKLPARLAVVVKGYPRLSETFIAQELLALQERGVPFEIWSLRRPTDGAVHPMHKAITARCVYLPEYLHEAPSRVVRGALSALRRPALGRLLRAFAADFRRDATASRLRRLGQALVMARELPVDVGHIHVHYLHTPASVARYAAILTGRRFSFSAHAKDIWTTPDWDISEKIADSLWGVTCTAQGQERLAALAGGEDKVALVYHGLDLDRFPPPPESRPPRDGTDPADPLRIVTVGRAVAKKGFDDLLQALTALPPDLHWSFVHVGGGELMGQLKRQAAELGLEGRTAFAGARNQPEVVRLLAEADLFVLPAKKAASGDRDGLPNVVMEAASQKLAIVASDFAGIPEFIRDGAEGLLVPPGDWAALANAINLCARDPARRALLGTAAYARLTADFGADAGADCLASRLRGALADAPGP